MARMAWSRRTRAAAVMTSAVLLASLAACDSGQSSPADPGEAATGGSGDSGSIEIVYLQKQGDQQYFVDQANGARDAAAEVEGVTVTVVNLGTDSNKAISELDSAIARDVDGIIMVAPDQAIGPQVIDKASQAGIPLLASDDGLVSADGTAAPFVGFNGTEMGRSVGTKAAELYETEGWDAASTRIVAVGKPDLSVCVQRLDGALEAFASQISEAPEVIEIDTDNSVTGAIDRAGAVITANQDVENWVVWGCNDESATGVVTALQNNGVAPEDIAGVGLGAYLACKDWASGTESGNRAALYISGYDVGTAAVGAMVAQLRDGVDLPPETIAETHMVDADTWQDAGVECT